MNLGLLCPELSALVILIFLMLGEMFFKNFSSRYSAGTAIAGALILSFTIGSRFHAQGLAFNDMFRADTFSMTMKLFFSLSIIPVIQMSQEFFRDRLKHPGEFILILWSSLIGMLFLSSANDLLMLFISLEIVTLSLYVMAAYLKKELFSIEAGLKYFIYGSMASAFFIFGISMIYVASGATAFAGVREFFALQPYHPLMIFGLLLLISGFGFKIAAAPFHLWVPDVYQGAPTPVTALLSVGSKAVGFVVALKVLFSIFGPFQDSRLILFSILSAITIFYGNLGALKQTNIKRLFGYSSISHAGYLMIGLAAGHISGLTAVLFYLFAYGATNLAAFLVICLVGRATGNDSIEAYRGLASRSPLLAAVLFISLLSLAGIPPLAGFTGKLLVLLAAVKSGLVWLAILGALMAAVSLYYYLTIVKIMYAEEPSANLTVPYTLMSRILLVLLAAAIILLGIFQFPLYHFAEEAARGLLILSS